MATTLILSGDLMPDTFCDFIIARAGVLDVDAVVLEATPHRVVVRVRGDHDLVGAFEMACELAPGSSVVHDVTHFD